ncbi:polysaccharide deacetylase family protein [Chitiniphilus purpureus]|uniref:Polysaccharide deacetylase family protein n=1 Tax=Chitiniphilus purpureus TaxID=2981137 RepID=A0ABY6DNR8_9NEIS|nr:polysaccharide deacetylase family protein [Chitiniphilus sp. CD1]UXY14751.1 polysaccharide deacetylase family protein [Chitiniphilus sp. CD1]
MLNAYAKRSRLGPVTQPLSNSLPGSPFFAFPRVRPAGVTLSGSPAESYEQFEGRWCMKITTPVGAFTDVVLPVPTPISIPGGDITALVHIESAATCLSVNLFAADSVGYVNYSYAGQTNPASPTFPTIARQGYVHVGINLPTGDNATDPQREWIVGGGAGMAFATTPVAAAKLRITPAAGTQATVRIFGVWHKERAKQSSIVLTFDDGWATQHSAALPILEKYGLRASLGIIGPLINQSTYMTTAQLREFIAAGSECVVHGNPSNPAYPGRLNLACYDTIPEIRADLRANADFLRSNDLVTNNSDQFYIYPQGVWQHAKDDRRILDALAQEGFTAARGTVTNAVSIIGGRWAKYDRWQIPIVGHLWAGAGAGAEDANITRIISRVTAAVNQGRCPWLTFHHFRAPTSAQDIDPANFEKICAAIADLINSGAAVNLLATEFVAQALAQ